MKRYKPDQMDIDAFYRALRIQEAAHDMYRALRGVNAKLPFTPNVFGGEHAVQLTQSEVDAIRAALAKADGEQKQ